MKIMWTVAALLFVGASIAAPDSTPAKKVIVQGAGASFPKNLYWDAIFAYKFVDTTSDVSYTSTGSGKGKCRIQSHADECSSTDTREPKYIDFAGSDSLLKTSNYDKYADLQMYPTIAGAVVPVFNLPNVADLVLTPVLVSQIFRGDCSTWDDQRIKDLNPDFAKWNIPAGQKIEVTVREDKSGTTEIFRKGLSKFEAAFNTQVGPKSDATWNGVNVTKRDGNQGVASHVLVTPYAIGYSVLGEAIKNHQPMAKMSKGGNIITPSALSVEYAVMEMGLSFGNNGDDPKRMTADIQNAQGNMAWPIAGYTYLIMRKDSIRQGATCANVKATVDFWYWFWHSDEVRTLAANLGFATLPKVVRDVVVSRFIKDIKCKGVVQFQASKKVQLATSGVTEMNGILGKFSDVYALVDRSTEISFTGSTAVDDLEVKLASDAVVAHTEASHTVAAVNSDTKKLLYAGFSYIMAGQVEAILDAATLQKILDGTITTWLDPAITALNPNGVEDRLNGKITNAAQKIVLLAGPSIKSASWETLMKGMSNRRAYTGTAIKAATSFNTEEELLSAIVGTPYSFAIVPNVRTISSQVKQSSFKRADGTALKASIASIKACATNAVFSTATFSFDLHKSKDTGCYPLSQTVYLSLKKSNCKEVTDSDKQRYQAVKFVEWMFSTDGSVDGGLEAYNVAPLRVVSSDVTVANQQVLDDISCAPKPPPGEALLLDTAALVVTAIGLTLVWLALTLPQAYFLIKMGIDEETKMFLKAVFIEAMLDAEEIFVGILVLMQIDTNNMSTPEQVQLGFVFLSILNLLSFNFTCILFLRRPKSTSKICNPTQADDHGFKIDDTGAIERAQMHFLLHKMHEGRSVHSVMSLGLVIPMLILETMIYLDSLAIFDLCCCYALATDMGIRIQAFVSVSDFHKAGTAALDLFKAGLFCGSMESWVTAVGHTDSTDSNVALAISTDAPKTMEDETKKDLDLLPIEISNGNGVRNCC